MSFYNKAPIRGEISAKRSTKKVILEKKNSHHAMVKKLKYGVGEG